MKQAWFAVTCEIDKGNGPQKINRIVYAPTISSAKWKAKTEFDSKASVKILSARVLPGATIFAKGGVEE